MKTFVEELKKQSDASETSSFRCFKALKAGNYKMSIQGSEGHYCTPRLTTTPELYSSMELALFSKRGWMHITKSNVLRSFPRYAELAERADGINSSSCVFGYVPVDLIEDLYLYLKNHK